MVPWSPMAPKHQFLCKYIGCPASFMRLKGNFCFTIAFCWKQHDFPFAVQAWMDSAFQLHFFTFFPWTWHLAVVKQALLIAGLPKSRAKLISCTPWLKKSLYQPPSNYNWFQVQRPKLGICLRLDTELEDQLSPTSGSTTQDAWSYVWRQFCFWQQHLRRGEAPVSGNTAPVI